jgi:hypothetical protein
MCVHYETLSHELFLNVTASVYWQCNCLIKCSPTILNEWARNDTILIAYQRVSKKVTNYEDFGMTRQSCKSLLSKFATRVAIQKILK